MQLYNKIMTYFWLAMAIVSFFVITYKGFMFGFKYWSVYYLFSVIALGMYFLKKWMIKRMNKHAAYLEEQKKNQA